MSEYNRTLLNRLLDETTSESAATIRREAYTTFSNAEFPAWKRIKVEDTTVPEFRKYNNQKVLYQQSFGLHVQPQPLISEELNQIIEGKTYGPSIKHRTLTEAFANAGTLIEVDAGAHIEEPVILQMAMNGDNPLLLDRHNIWVRRNASLTVVLDYSDDGSLVYHNGIINLVAETGSNVHVVKIQNLNDSSTHIFSGLSIVGRDAQVRFNSIDLGGNLTVTDYSTYLQEENSQSFVDSIYLGDGDRKLDLGYNITHKGRRSQSEISVHGALLDASHKVFRGNLVFEKGATRSKGAEEEYVILLDERVKADAIPALLCSEDDVQGEHAASAGQVDAHKLFYLMSRGLTEKEAKQLIIMAAFAPVIEQLPITGLKERIHKTVGEKLNQDLK